MPFVERFSSRVLPARLATATGVNAQLDDIDWFALAAFLTKTT